MKDIGLNEGFVQPGVQPSTSKGLFGQWFKLSEVEPPVDTALVITDEKGEDVFQALWTGKNWWIAQGARKELGGQIHWWFAIPDVPREANTDVPPAEVSAEEVGGDVTTPGEVA